MTTTFTEIAYGPEHGAALRTLLGVGARTIDTVVYEQPARAGYALADGRYAMITTTKYGASSRVHVYGDYAAFRAAWRGALTAVPDPERGGDSPASRRQP